MVHGGWTVPSDPISDTGPKNEGKKCRTIAQLGKSEDWALKHGVVSCKLRERSKGVGSTTADSAQLIKWASSKSAEEAVGGCGCCYGATDPRDGECSGAGSFGSADLFVKSANHPSGSSPFALWWRPLGVVGSESRVGSNDSRPHGPYNATPITCRELQEWQFRWEGYPKTEAAASGHPECASAKWGLAGCLSGSLACWAAVVGHRKDM